LSAVCVGDSPSHLLASAVAFDQQLHQRLLQSEDSTALSQRDR
jgi:hypothetical protein